MQESRGRATRPSSLRGQARTAFDENIDEIKSWEQANLHARSRTEQVADWIAATAATGPVLVAHVIWFSTWIAANVRLIPGLRPFDPFPFPLLTTIVSLEAIFLALFVLASQNRLSKQGDKRSHLDLQIDLLAEREMTAVLRLLLDIARHLKIESTVTPDQLRDLAKRTDLHALTRRTAEITDEQETLPEKRSSG